MKVVTPDRANHERVCVCERERERVWMVFTDRLHWSWNSVLLCLYMCICLYRHRERHACEFVHICTYVCGGGGSLHEAAISASGRISSSRISWSSSISSCRITRRGLGAADTIPEVMSIISHVGHQGSFKKHTDDHNNGLADWYPAVILADSPLCKRNNCPHMSLMRCFSEEAPRERDPSLRDIDRSVSH